MKLTKTTINFAEKRGFQLDELDGVMWFFNTSDCEPDFTYTLSSNESFPLSFRHNTLLCDSIKEELPAHINNEKELRKVIDFVYKEMTEVNEND